MSDPTPSTLKQAFEEIRRAAAAAREGLDDLPEIVRAEVREHRAGGSPRTADSSLADAETSESTTPPALARPDFTAFDSVVRARVDELTEQLGETLK